MMRRRVLCMLGVAGGLLVSSAVYAQGAPPASSPPSGDEKAPASEDAKLKEARERHARGVQLLGEGNCEAGRVEFQRAYELAPSYKILFNLGLCHARLGDYVSAMKAFSKFLAEGGPEINAEKRDEVNKEIERIRPRIARVTVKTNVPDADVSVDDVPEEKTEMDAAGGRTLYEVLLNSGRRKITVSKPGYFPVVKTITVAGSDRSEIAIELQEVNKPLATKEEKKNPWVVPAIVGWSVTGAAAIGATVTGIIALNAASERDDQVGTLGATRAGIDSKGDDTKSIATVTDVLLIVGGVAAGVSAYLTVRAATYKGETSEKTEQAKRTNIITPLGARIWF
jgi:hypothetical protein